MSLHLVTLERSGAYSSYRIYTDKIRIALEQAGAGPVVVDALRTSAEARHGGVLRPTLAHYLGRFPRDGELRHATEPNTALRGTDVVTIHDLYPFLEPGLMFRVFRAVSRSAARRARAIVTQVETIREDIGRYLGAEAKQKTFVVPPPFPIPPAGREPPATDVLWIGSTDRRKRPDLFLRGIAGLPGPSLRVTFLCHGASADRPGELAAPFAAARARHQVDWVSRSIEGPALETLYRSSRALVSTSALEGYHNPPMEAWARGTPAVLPRIPLYREIYGTVGGVRYYDPSASFAESLAAALADGPHTPDPGLLRSVSFPEVGRRLAEVYRRLGWSGGSASLGPGA